ncbi:hypothetical protein PFISCL1PPCAC_784, partial [Pristionchus fissidentatus]
VTLSERGLIDQLQEEHFDAGLTENFDSCGYGLFHLLAIDKYATVNTLAVMDGQYSMTQVPVNTAYVPTMMGGKYGDRMTFFERLLNTLTYLNMDSFLDDNVDIFQSVFDKNIDDAPRLKELMSNSSLVFMNSDPIIDFPKLTSSKVIDIGGISVHAGHNPLNTEWSDILNLRNETIFISFGTFVKSHLMPDLYKRTIRETIKKFPNVTFVWKYEKPEHQISEGIDNLVETTWGPQHDLLHDPRLTAFITHGGQGSITESAGAGIPLICIPVTADQLRNAQLVVRNGLGIMVHKEELARMEPLEDAIRRILSDESYRSTARLIAEMIDERPFSMKDVFVRNMEYLVKYGPHRRFDHYGAQLNFVQYYLIDVFGFLAVCGIVSAVLAVYVIRFLVAKLSDFVVLTKIKSE